MLSRLSEEYQILAGRNVVTLPNGMVDEDELESARPIFRNYYLCPYDGTSWIDEWSCRCNDRCPRCRAEIEPYDSEDI
jgi:hypothetical protein